MGRTACTEPQYLYKGALHLYLLSYRNVTQCCLVSQLSVPNKEEAGYSEMTRDYFAAHRELII